MTLAARVSARPRATRSRVERERRERARNSRNPVVRATAGLPRGVRITIDWAVTIIGAIAIVLAIKAWVVNPYRIPSSSMEPTLHCARPGSGCESRFSDRVLANRFIYHLRDPERGDIIVFKTPKAAEAEVRRGRHIRQAARRAARRDVGGARRRRLHQRQAAGRALRPRRPPRLEHVRPTQDSRRAVLLHGGQPRAVVRLARMGRRAEGEHHRRSLLRLLAADADRLPHGARPPRLRADPAAAPRLRFR